MQHPPAPGRPARAGLLRATCARIACCALALATTALAARADVVHLKDGRRLEGVVLSRDAGSLRLKTRLGEITVPLADVLRIEEGETPEQELARREARARGPEELLELGDWARKRRLQAEAKRLYERVLALDPDHAAARERLGHVRHEGEWMTAEERARRTAAAEEAARLAAGLVLHEGQWIPREDKERLEKGLVLHEGRWLGPGELERARGLEQFEGSWMPRAEALARGRAREVERVSGRPLVLHCAPDALLAGPLALSILEEIGVGLARGRLWFAATFGLPTGLAPFGGELPELYLWDDAGPAYEESVPHFAARTRYLPEGWIEAASRAHGFVYWDPTCVSSVRIGRRAPADLAGHCYHHWGHLLVNRLVHDGRLLPPWYDEAVAALVEHRTHGQNRVFCRALAGPAQGSSARRAAHDVDPDLLRRGEWRRILAEALAASRAPSFDLVARREFFELELLDVLVGMALVEWLAERSPEAPPAFHAVLRKHAPRAPQRVIAEAGPRQAVYDEAFRAACGMGWREADQAWRRWLSR